MSPRTVLVLTTLFALLGAQTAAAEDGFMYVEGYVFDVRSHAPVPGVQLSARAPLDEACTPEGECAPVAGAATDPNGFYQLRIPNADSLRSASLSVQALCIVTNSDGEFRTSSAGSIEARPVEAERILRRDLYIRVPRHFRRSTGCDPSGRLPGPEVIPLPFDPPPPQ